VPAYLNFKLIENEDTPVWENFVKGFKSSFMQGTLMWIFTVLVSGCLFFIWRTVLESGFSMMSIGAVICTLVLVMFFVYTFPLIARYNNTLKNIFKNSAGMSFTYWVKTILYLISFATFVIPGLCIYIQSVITKGMFTQMELHQKNVEAESAESDSESE